MENENIIKLTESQILVLQLSDYDIEAGRLIPHEQLDKEDLEWLQEQ